MTSHHKIVLAIESAVAGGSISLLRDGSEIGNWIGSQSSISKAEDLLVNIDQLLKQHGLDLGDLDLVSVSAGPGSFTGIRIGIATALGLKAGLGIALASESALKALVQQNGGDHNDLTVALPVGRNSVCVQRFSKGESDGEPSTIDEAAFAALIDDRSGSAFLVHELLYRQLSDTSGVINAGANIALAVGLICSREPAVMADPLFIAKTF